MKANKTSNPYASLSQQTHNKPQNNNGKAKVEILLINGQICNLELHWGKSGKNIRNIIFNELSDELKPEQMSLYYNNLRIKSDLKLSKLNAPAGTVITIKQQKIEVGEIPGVSSERQTKDLLTQEVGVLKMCCGHFIGRDSIVQLMRKEIAAKKTRILCPFKTMGIFCNIEWTFAECELVGVLTKSQKQQLSTGLTKNLTLSQSSVSSFHPVSQIQQRQSQQPQQPQQHQQHQQPQQPQQTYQQSQQPLQQIQQNKLTITIVTLRNQQFKVTLKSSTTGSQLKDIIYKKISQSLQPNMMSLYYEGTKLGKSTKLSDLHIVVGSQLKIRQTKADIADINNIVADIQGIDTISLEQGTAKMTCGHSIGRDTMTTLVRSLVTSNKYQIRCPYPDDNEMPCRAIWTFKDCKKIGVFTREEVEQFEKGLSLNWIRQFSKKCPNCKQQICKLDLKTNRVVCPACKFGDFCYLCLNRWVGGKTCGNIECQFLENLLTGCPWNRIFQLYDRNEGKVKAYSTPQYRACPRCYLVIEHREACKHMTCIGCTKKFCWVCLGLLTNGNWSCGNHNEYCGKVAQAQQFFSG